MSYPIPWKDTIDPDWLGDRDVDYLSDLVQQWLAENNHNVESFSFSIEVNWESNDE